MKREDSNLRHGADAWVRQAQVARLFITYHPQSFLRFSYFVHLRMLGGNLTSCCMSVLVSGFGLCRQEGCYERHQKAHPDFRL